MPLCQPSGRSSNVSAGPRRGAASSAEGEGFEPPGPRGLARFQDGCLIHFSQPSTSALSRGRTCNNVFLRHAPLPVGLPEHRTRQSMDAGGNRTLISWVQTKGLPVRRRAHFQLPALREGVEPSASAFGGPRSDPVELPQRLPCAGWEAALASPPRRHRHSAFSTSLPCTRQDSNLQPSG